MISLSRRTSSLSLAVALAASIAACSTGSNGPASTGAATSGPVATAQGSTTQAPGGPTTTSSTAVGGTDYCKLFTLAEVGALMGGTVGVDTTNTQPKYCTWFTSNGATVLMKQDTADTCSGDMGLVQSQGGAKINGSHFVGPAIAGAYIAGNTVNGACYEVVVANGYTPDLGKLSDFLDQLVQRAGA